MSLAMYLQLHILNLIFRNLQILFDNFELLQEIFSRRNILFFFRFVWIWKSIEYSLELRKGQNLGPTPLSFLVYGRNIFEKINTKGLQGGFLTDEKRPFFLQISERIIRKKIGHWLGRRDLGPPPLSLNLERNGTQFVCL